MKWLRISSSLILSFLLIEFLDEFVFGAREAAWPLIRDDLQLTYLQIGLILGMPGVVSSFVEPIFGILGDVWKRRVLILGGGIFFVVALLLIATSQNFLWLLLATVLFYPASGAFVSLSQAALMDSEPQRHEQNMARWTFAGSLGVVIGPLVLGGFTLLGWNWRGLFLLFAVLSLGVLVWAWRASAVAGGTMDQRDPRAATTFGEGVVAAFQALKQGEVLRWLILLQFADLMLDVLYGYLALYFVDVAGAQPEQAALAVAVWTGAGLLGDLLLIPLLERVHGLHYLRLSALIVLILFPAFLLAPSLPLKIALVGLLGLLNAGWYAIPKGQLYSSLPGQSGIVMTVDNLFGLVGALIPLGLGWLAFQQGLEAAMWVNLLGPLALLLGIPRKRSKIKVEECSP